MDMVEVGGFVVSRLSCAIMGELFEAGWAGYWVSDSEVVLWLVGSCFELNEDAGLPLVGLHRWGLVFGDFGVRVFRDGYGMGGGGVIEYADPGFWEGLLGVLDA